MSLKIKVNRIRIKEARKILMTVINDIINTRREEVDPWSTISPKGDVIETADAAEAEFISEDEDGNEVFILPFEAVKEIHALLSLFKNTDEIKLFLTVKFIENGDKFEDQEGEDF